MLLSAVHGWYIYIYIFYCKRRVTGGASRTVVGHFPIPGRNFVDAVYHIGKTYTLNYLQIANEIAILCKKRYYTCITFYNLSFVAH